MKPFLASNFTKQQSEGTSTASTTSSQKSSVDAIFEDLKALERATEGNRATSKAASKHLKKATTTHKKASSIEVCNSRKSSADHSGDSQRFQRGDCLRCLDTICYCEACIEFRGAECSSPRMAELRKSKAVLSMKK